MLFQQRYAKRKEGYILLKTAGVFVAMTAMNRTENREGMGQIQEWLSRHRLGDPGALQVQTREGRDEIRVMRPPMVAQWLV